MKSCWWRSNGTVFLRNPVISRAKCAESVLLSQLTLSMCIAASAFADFSGPYAVTPPAPGHHHAAAGAQLPFGTNWFLLGNAAGGISVDSTSAPQTLVLDTELI